MTYYKLFIYLRAWLTKSYYTYNLFLTKDNRTKLNYDRFIAKVWTKKKKYIKKIKLWDLCSKKISERKSTS